MTTIDQRILIPAAQTVVWAFISNINNNPEWQAEYKGISYLTSRREGPGTRWRYTTDKGREYVVEITAWYNGLGYEYVFVDGPGYKENRGRIRLQEIAEGTIVQWTFTYEIGGMFAGMRNHRRQIENNMAASLKALYRKIKQFAADGMADPKSLMRDAPDVEARQQYRPRHPSAVSKPQEEAKPMFQPEQTPVVFDEPPVLEDDAQTLSPFAIPEPPIEAEDTRPRPVVTAVEPPAAEQASEESIYTPEYSIDESRFAPPREVEDTVRSEQTFAPPQPETPARVEEAEARAQVEEGSAAEPEQPEEALETITEPLAEVHEAVADEVEAGETEEQQETTPSIPAEAEPMLPPADPERSAASIWEIFGVPRPTEVLEAAPAAQDEPGVQASTATTHVMAGQGLRLRLRRNLTRLRRPF